MSRVFAFSIAAAQSYAISLRGPIKGARRSVNGENFEVPERIKIDNDIVFKYHLPKPERPSALSEQAAQWRGS